MEALQEFFRDKTSKTFPAKHRFGLSFNAYSDDRRRFSVALAL